jgi:hypothetical protein
VLMDERNRSRMVAPSVLRREFVEDMS